MIKIEPESPFAPGRDGTTEKIDPEFFIQLHYLRRTAFPPADLGNETGHRVKKRIFMPVGGPGQEKS